MIYFVSLRDNDQMFDNSVTDSFRDDAVLRIIDALAFRANRVTLNRRAISGNTGSIIRCPVWNCSNDDDRDLLQN